MDAVTSPARSIWFDAALSARPFPRLDESLTVDVAVIGGGITGLTAARLLKIAGRKVAVIEAARVGGGESGKSTAHLTQALDARYHRLISNFGLDGARLAARAHREAIDRIAAWVGDLRIDCDFQRTDGFLFAETSEGVAEIEAEGLATAHLGLPTELTSTTPLPFAIKRALRFPDQAQLQPAAYLAALAADVAGGGCHVLEGTTVLDVDEGGGGGGDDDLCRVVTDRGVVKAHDVIVAAHVPISNRFLVHTKIAAYRTYAVSAKAPVGETPGLFWDVADPYHYVRSCRIWGTPYLVVGGEDHKVADDRHAAGAFDRLAEYVRSHFGALEIVHRWSGQIIEPSDGLPYVGRNSFSSRVFVATGYAGNGMTGGTAAGILLSDLILGQANACAELFDATRIKPLASARAYLSENVDFPLHMVGDRVRAARHPQVIADVARGQGRVVTVGKEKLAVYRDTDGQVHALSPACTHLGCLVHWNGAERSWDCPCHGSRFDVDGKVLNGPAVSALAARPIPEGEGEAPPSEAAGEGEAEASPPEPAAEPARHGRPPV